MEVMSPNETTTILDVGVTCDEEHSSANMLERCYPYKHRITCAGVEDASHLENEFPGIKFVQIRPHQQLPFADEEFEIVHSNAVVEHVGTRQQQTEFIEELCRVGKQVFIVVPNRLFPVEHHTALPFLHYLPNRIFRFMAKFLGFTFWSTEEHLNLFYPWELAKWFPQDNTPKIIFRGIGLGFFKSNVVAYFNK